MSNSIEFFPEFSWAVPKNFAVPLRDCRFEQGDRLFDTKLAYEGHWNEAKKHIKHSIEVIAPPRGEGVTKTKADSASTFESNWDSSVVIELTDHANGDVTEMGAAIAQREKTNPVPGTPTDPKELKNELASYVAALDVENHLHTYGEALQELEKLKEDAHYFLLSLDPASKKLSILGYPDNELQKASDDYLALEKEIKGSTRDVVLVSVDSLSALRKAYPNYFLDTHMFVELVKIAIR